MKKMMVFATMVLLALSSHAVVQNWSMTNFTYSLDQGFTTSSSFNQGCYNTVNVKFSDTSKMTATGKAEGTNVTLQSVRIGLKENNNNMTQPAYLLLLDGTNVIAASTAATWTGNVVQYASATSGDYYTRSAWDYTFNATGLDAEKTYTFALATEYSATDNTYTLFSTDNTNWGSQRIAVTNQKNDTLVLTSNWSPFIAMSGTYTPVPVPEPTCLALLALGVAGIALKRKVA